METDQPERVYGGKSLDERRAQRRQRLFNAVFDCLRDDTADRLSVRQVLVRSRLNQRYVYQEFGGLDGMLQAGFDAAFAELSDYLQSLAQRPPASVEAGAAALARAVCTFIEDKPHKARLILVDSLKVGCLASRRRDAIRDLSAAFYQYLNRWVGDGTHTRDELMLVSRFLVGATGEVIIGTLDQSIPGSAADHVDVLARLFADTLRQFDTAGP